MMSGLKGHQFLFEELVKRDFKKKYKRKVLGMGWSMLMPLLTLLVMAESTNSGMRSLYDVMLECRDVSIRYMVGDLQNRAC